MAKRVDLPVPDVSEKANDLPATTSEEMPSSCWVLTVAAGILACDFSNL